MNGKNSLKSLLPILLGLVVLLTGCVRYDVGVNFNTPNQGAIVQNIKIGEQLNNLSPGEVRKWLGSVEDRARSLQGKIKRINNREILVTIPFGNGEELTEKFNQFFHTNNATSAIVSDKNDVVQLDSQIALEQNNLVFVERNSLDLTIDLRALEVISDRDKIVLRPESLIDLEFKLKTPLIARSIAGENNLEPNTDAFGKSLVWRLQPGQINHIKAVFWLPNPLGIGTVAIALFVLLGYFLKYGRLPGVT